MTAPRYVVSISTVGGSGRRLKTWDEEPEIVHQGALRWGGDGHVRYPPQRGGTYEVPAGRIYVREIPESLRAAVTAADAEICAAKATLGRLLREQQDLLEIVVSRSHPIRVAR